LGKKFKLISKIDTKLHHLFTGGFGAYLTPLFIPEIFINDVIPESATMLFTVATIAIPLIRIGHHRKKKTKAHRSMLTCISE